MRGHQTLIRSAISLLVALGGSAAWAAERPSPRLAQAICGWFAIYHCSPGAADARRFSNRFRGYVIDTDDARYPTFRPGYYCVVEGPTSKSQAQRLADRAKYSGVAPTAYIKDPCFSNPR